MSLTDEDIETLSNQIVNQWGLTDFIDIDVLASDAVKFADLQLESKYPDAYVEDLTSNTPKAILFQNLRKLFSLVFLFTNNDNLLSEYTRKIGITSVSNPDAGSVNFGNAKKFELSNTLLQISRLMQNLGLRNSNYVGMDITVNSLI